jgi:hypothetical protein
MTESTTMSGRPLVLKATIGVSQAWASRTLLGRLYWREGITIASPAL